MMEGSLDPFHMAVKIEGVYAVGPGGVEREAWGSWVVREFLVSVL